MKNQSKDPSRVSYRSGSFPEANTKADVFVGNHVPMNSISAGHPIMGEPILSVEELRNLMLECVKNHYSTEETIAESGPVKKLTPPRNTSNK